MIIGIIIMYILEFLRPNLFKIEYGSERHFRRLRLASVILILESLAVVQVILWLSIESVKLSYFIWFLIITLTTIHASASGLFIHMFRHLERELRYNVMNRIVDS